MSTLSYLRVQLRQAERRLAKYQRRRADIAEPSPSVEPAVRVRRLTAFDMDDGYINAQRAVQNLTAALHREESRLAGDPAARL